MGDSLVNQRADGRADAVIAAALIGLRKDSGSVTMIRISSAARRRPGRTARRAGSSSSGPWPISTPRACANSISAWATTITSDASASSRSPLLELSSKPLSALGFARRGTRARGRAWLADPSRARRSSGAAPRSDAHPSPRRRPRDMIGTLLWQATRLPGRTPFTVMRSGGKRFARFLAHRGQGRARARPLPHPRSRRRRLLLDGSGGGAWRDRPLHVTLVNLEPARPCRTPASRALRAMPAGCPISSGRRLRHRAFQLGDRACRRAGRDKKPDGRRGPASRTPLFRADAEFLVSRSSPISGRPGSTGCREPWQPRAS